MFETKLIILLSHLALKDSRVVVFEQTVMILTGIFRLWGRDDWTGGEYGRERYQSTKRGQHL